MELYAVRQAVSHKRDADLWPDDSKRPLTTGGEECFRRAARGILRLVPEVDLVLSSSFTRAWRTAELLERQGWPAPVPCEELEPDYPLHKVVGVLADHAGVGSVAVVGHRSGLHELVSYLLIGDAEGANVQIKKGGIVRLQIEGCPDPGFASLRWLATPKVLRAVRSEPPRDPEG